METLKALEEGTIVPQKQGETPTHYASMLNKKNGKHRLECFRRSNRETDPGIKFLAECVYTLGE